MSNVARHLATKKYRAFHYNERPLSWIRKVKPMSDLASKKCKPCEGGVTPLTANEARKQMAGIDAAWMLLEDGKTIMREFEFPTYSRNIAFVNAVAWIATVEGHHPEMLVRYKSCRITYTTTAIDGLSENDFICAAKIDRLVDEQ
jgi:4a-hydroxytetrahydrobiopterin dehydratase